ELGLVLRLAAFYGEPMDNDATRGHARALIATLASGIGLRYLAEQAAKAVPFGGDFLAGAIAAGATWSIGQVALEYYEENGQLSPKRLQKLYKTFYQRFRKDNVTKELQAQTSSSNDTGTLLEEPHTGSQLERAYVGERLAPVQKEKA